MKLNSFIVSHNTSIQKKKKKKDNIAPLGQRTPEDERIVNQ
jgi:hypothetical protein